MTESVAEPAVNYRSYLLRVWRATPAHPWRASVECVTDGQKRIFTQPEALLDFLNAMSDADAPVRRPARP